MKNSYILMQDNDDKVEQWAGGARKLGVTIAPMAKSPIFIPYYVFHYWLSRRQRPQAVVLRYLNDYPNIAKTVARALSEFLVVLMCILGKIRLVWICHNVDRETREYYPNITRIRRRLVSKAAETILVTDPLLVSHAQQVFSTECHKIDYVTFGPSLGDIGKPIDHSATQRIIEFLKARKQRFGNKMLAGLAIGRANDKTIHFQFCQQLIEAAKRIGQPLVLVVVGPIGEYLKELDPGAYQYLHTADQVLFLDEYLAIDEEKVAGYIDFFWRGYRDLSVPYSLYHAVLLRIPMLVLDVGFLGEVVSRESLGATVKKDFSNLREALGLIRTWTPDKATAFLGDHNWVTSTKRLLAACGFVRLGDPEEGELHTS